MIGNQVTATMANNLNKVKKVQISNGNDEGVITNFNIRNASPNTIAVNFISTNRDNLNCEDLTDIIMSILSVKIYNMIKSDLPSLVNEIDSIINMVRFHIKIYLVTKDNSVFSLLHGLLLERFSDSDQRKEKIMNIVYHTIVNFVCSIKI